MKWYNKYIKSCWTVTAYLDLYNCPMLVKILHFLNRLAVVVHLAMSSIIFHKIFGHLCSDHINMAYLISKNDMAIIIGKMQLIIALVNNSFGCQESLYVQYYFCTNNKWLNIWYSPCFKNTNVNGYDYQEVMSMISSIVHVYEEFCTNHGTIFCEIIYAL